MFDGTLQKTQIWLNEIMTQLDWQEHPQKAYLALRTVLHALRDRLTVDRLPQRADCIQRSEYRLAAPERAAAPSHCSTSSTEETR